MKKFIKVVIAWIVSSVLAFLSYCGFCLVIAFIMLIGNWSYSDNKIVYNVFTITPAFLIKCWITYELLKEVPKLGKQ